MRTCRRCASCSGSIPRSCPHSRRRQSEASRRRDRARQRRAGGRGHLDPLAPAAPETLKPLRIGTRGSALALAQANAVAAALRDAGCRDPDRSHHDQRGHARRAPADKSRFVKEIEDALLAGEVDLAVHSAKDVPGRLPDGLEIAAVPSGEDPRDALVGAASGIDELPDGARVGTSSLRRRSQLLAISPAHPGRCRCGATWTRACASSPTANTTRWCSRSPACAAWGGRTAHSLCPGTGSCLRRGRACWRSRPVSKTRRQRRSARSTTRPRAAGSRRSARSSRSSTRAATRRSARMRVVDADADRAACVRGAAGRHGVDHRPAGRPGSRPAGRRSRACPPSARGRRRGTATSRPGRGVGSGAGTKRYTRR